jgi:hypothetical protein
MMKRKRVDQFETLDAIKPQNDLPVLSPSTTGKGKGKEETNIPLSIKTWDNEKGSFCSYTKRQQIFSFPDRFLEKARTVASKLKMNPTLIFANVSIANKQQELIGKLYNDLRELRLQHDEALREKEQQLRNLQLENEQLRSLRLENEQLRAFLHDNNLAPPPRCLKPSHKQASLMAQDKIAKS